MYPNALLTKRLLPSQYKARLVKAWPDVPWDDLNPRQLELVYFALTTPSYRDVAMVLNMSYKSTANAMYKIKNILAPYHSTLTQFLAETTLVNANPGPVLH